MHKYDIACVGAGMAGLAAAALLTRAGKSVCLMDPAETAGGCIAVHTSAGFRHFPGPSMTYGFEPEGILHQLFAGLGLSAGPSDPFPGYQVVMPEHRIEVSGDPRQTLEELVREFPDATGGLTRLYREAQRLIERSSRSRFFSYVLRQRSAAAYLLPYGFDRSITAYFDVQSRYFFGSSLRDLPLASLVLLLTSAPSYLPEGFTRIADQLLSVVQQNNGAWHHGEAAPELRLRANRIVEIKTSRGIIEPRTVLLNVPGDQPESILFLGIRNEVIPVGMLPNVLCIAEDERVDGYFTLSLSPGDDRGTASANRTSLTAVFPPAGMTIDQSVDAYFDRIAPVVPFLQEFVVDASIQDRNSRQLLLPSSVTIQSPEYRPGRPMLAPCSVKNLRIIPDSVRTLLPAVSTAQTVASKLH